MKRRTKDKIGAFPNMKDTTLKAIADELIRARKKHPEKITAAFLRTIYESLVLEIVQNDSGMISAAQVYARAAQLAAMAVRILEEGVQGYKYADYLPSFKLESEQ